LIHHWTQEAPGAEKGAYFIGAYKLSNRNLLFRETLLNVLIILKGKLRATRVTTCRVQGMFAPHQIP
jgi:hypothetical protein